MSTRATITVADAHESFDLYQHHDGYPDGPHGLVRHIDRARRLSWDLPRFEAADFAAAIIAVLKDRGGSTYLTKDAEAHDDRSFHYRITPLQKETTTSVMLTITRPSWERGKPDIEVFTGGIHEAIKQFDAVAEPSQGPREWQMLEEIEAAVFRAEEDILQWTNDKTNPDSQAALDNINNAGRVMCRLRHHVEKSNPWEILKKAQTILENMENAPANRYATLTKTEVHLAMDAHRRFQRDG